MELPRPKDDDLIWRVRDTEIGKWVVSDRPPYVTDVDQRTKGLVSFIESAKIIMYDIERDGNNFLTSCGGIG